MEVAEILSHKYPFGREHEASVQLLFRTFCNNLFLGQFELARASLQELHNQRSFLKTTPLDVLRRPIDKWFREHIIHRLTWPTFLEYQALDDDTAQNTKVREEIEYCLVLADVCKNAHTQVVQELYELRSAKLTCPSDLCRDYLIQTLLRAPASGALMLSYLTTTDTKELMDSLVIDALHQCISNKENKEAMFSLLSRTSLDLENFSTKSRVSDVLTAILMSMASERGFCFGDYLKLYSSVTSQQQDSLYQLLVSVEREVFAHSSQLQTIRKWRGRALDTLKNHDHFFNTLMNEASTLIKERKYDDLVKLLNNDEWRPLLPFFFHLAWRQCNRLEDSHYLSTAFAKVADDNMRLLIDQHQRIDVIEQSLNIASESSRRPDISSAILSAGSTQSVLHALLVCLDDLSSWSRQKMMNTLSAPTAYALLRSETDDKSQQASTCSLSSDQMRDISLFNAFYILNTLIDILAVPSERLNINTHSFIDRYREHSLPQLNSIKKLLDDLRPINLRLEVLEDLFSLLFTTSSDLSLRLSSQQESPCPKIPEVSLEGRSDDDEQYYSAKEAVSPQKPVRLISAPAALHSSSKTFQTASRRLDLGSGPASDSSGAEDDGTHKTVTVGFLANEFVIRDVLIIIQDALTQLTTLRLKNLDDTAWKAEENRLSQLTLASVTDDSFLSRSTALQRRVSEAVWRQQLILRDVISKDFGSTVIYSIQRDRQLDDDGYADYERSLLTSSRKPQTSLKPMSVSSADSELSSEQYTGGSSTGGAAGGQSGVPRSKRLRKRRERVGSMASGSPKMPSIINRMLSSPVSLLNLCIKRHNQVLAQQVLKIFNMEESDEGKELEFSQAYKIFLEELSNQRTTNNKPKGLTKGLDLAALRRAASNTINAITGSSKAEGLASKAVFPNNPTAVDDKIVRLFSRHFDPDNVQSMVLLDLACVATDDPDLTSELLTLAQKLLANSQPDYKSKIPGIFAILKHSVDINELALASEQKTVKSLLTFDHENLSIRSCLLSLQLALDAQQVNDQLKPLIDISKDITTMERALAAWKKSGREEQLMTTFPIRTLIQELNKHYPNKGSHRSYLSDLYQQIKTLHSVIVSNSSDQSSYHDNHFTVLEDGPTMIMGRLIFEDNVEPLKLEAVAAKVNLDLTHVIVRSCCLPIRCKPAKGLTPATDNPYIDKKPCYGYRAVLNAPLNGQAPDGEHISDPEAMMVSLLNQLLDIVKAVCLENDVTILDQTHCLDIAQSAEFQQFTAKSRLLRSVNLESLKTDQQKRSFFVNLHNVMSLHGVILYLTSVTRQQAKENSISQLLAFHMTTSYIVGQLGVCSIFEIQQFMLKASSKIQQLDLSREHPWFLHAPVYDSKTVCLLYEGNLNVMPVRCTSAATITQDTISSLNNYIANAVIIDPQERTITVPYVLLKIFKEQQDSVDNSQSASYSQESNCYQHADLLAWILKHQKANKWPTMKNIMDQLKEQECGSSHHEDSDSVQSGPYASVTVLPSHTCLGYSLSTEHSLRQILNPEQSCESDGGDDLSTSYKISTTDSKLHQAKFTISQEAVNYIRAKSPIVAILLDIINDDMNVTKPVEVSVGEASKSDGELQQGKSHFCCDTLRRDYPTLTRYLSEYVISLCTHLDNDANSLEQVSQLDLPQSVKASILTHKSSRCLQQAARACIDALGNEDKYDLIVKVINKLMSLSYDVPAEWLAVRDYSLIQCASERVSNESLACIKQLTCQRLQAHIAIACLHKSRWTVEKCLQILPLCERRLSETGDNCLVEHIQNLMQKMSAFHRIMLHAQAKQDITIEGCPDKVVEQLSSDWQCVAEHLAQNPSYVFHLLFDAEEFMFAKSLAAMKRGRINPDLLLLVTTKYLVHIIDKDGSLYLATQVLTDKLSAGEVEWTYDLCMAVLRDLMSCSGMLHVTQFLMNDMMSRVDEDDQEAIELCHIGVQMLALVDEDSQHQYRSIIFSPLLILEQLLMNSKITWTEKVLDLIRSHEWSCDGAMRACSSENINKLLCLYAEKAVDFPVIIPPQADQSGASQPIPVGLNSLRSIMSLARLSSPIASSPSQKASILGTSVPKSPAAGTSLPRNISRSSLSRVTTAPATLSTLVESGSMGLSVSMGNERMRQAYATIPEAVPSRDHWVPDEAVTKCMACQVETFSMFTRRHHCRRCGRVVCASCSSKTAPVNDRIVRVCDDCYNFIHRIANSGTRMKDRQSGAAMSISPIISTMSLPDIEMITPEWLLTMDEHLNEDVRYDFFYDHAPSVSLCTAILTLYNDGIECGKHMLTLCQKLSVIIRPIRPESTNQEVDYNLVINMMKFLLLNAKLLFVKDQYTEGISQCEAYSNRVDVLSLLLFACYLDLPTVDDLASIDSIRRLRDKLMEDERLDLALEISTKFALETTAIWSAWGLKCLRQGDYPGARDKFSKVLKPISDKALQTVPYSKLIGDIITTIEGQATQCPSTYTQSSIHSALKGLLSGSLDIGKTVPPQCLDGVALDENQIHVQECLYYLEAYANYHMLVNFYREHGFWQKALETCYRKKCVPEVFMTCLFQPAVLNGQLRELQDQILMLDQYLDKSAGYMRAACRWLSKTNQHHTLYHIQLFLEDYIRAAMTCIQMFYLKGATNYSELHGRLLYLNKALDHLQSYLHPGRHERLPQTSKTAKIVKGSEATNLKLTQPEVEIRRHINTINLQIEVTKTMYQSGSRQQAAITLFGDIDEKVRTTAIVIMSGKNIKESFDLGYRVIQDFELPYRLVYRQIASVLGECGSAAQVKQLITCIKDTGLSDVSVQDDAVLAAIASCPTDSKECEALIKLLQTNAAKIEGLIVSKKLRQAYLLAVKENSVATIERIAEAAVKHNQPSVKQICDKYLSQGKQ